jgi:SAM-dependent methyltransferase
MKNNSIFCPHCLKKSEIYCSSVKDFYFFSEGSWDYFKCTNTSCMAIWPYPFPDSKSLEFAYNNYYTHKVNNKILVSSFYIIILRIAFGIFRVKNIDCLFKLPVLGRMFEDLSILSGVIAPNKHGTILDVGCGSGSGMSLLKFAGWKNVIGIESDSEAVRAGVAANNKIIHGFASDMPVKSSSVDAVFLHHVIEHLKDPASALVEIARVLKKNGELIIITPNVESGLRHKWGRYWRGFEAPRHLFLFDFKSLAAMLLKNGFSLKVSRTSSRSAYWIDRISSEAAGKGIKDFCLLDSIFKADAFYRKQKTEFYDSYKGDELVFVAVKN